MIAPKQRGPQGGYRLPGAEVTTRPATDVRARLWRAMRVLRRFDIPQLLIAVEDAARANATDYCMRLARTGFLRGVFSNRRKVYQLVRDSGPLAPITRKTGDTYDQNTKKTHLDGGVEREVPRDADE